MTRCGLIVRGIYGFLTAGLGAARRAQTVRRGVSPVFTAYRGARMLQEVGAEVTSALSSFMVDLR